MIECVVKTLASHGVTDAVLSLGYLPDRFIQAYPDNQIAGVSVTYAVEPEPLDTAGAIRFAATFAGIDETFIVGAQHAAAIDPSQPRTLSLIATVRF